MSKQRIKQEDWLGELYGFKWRLCLLTIFLVVLVNGIFIFHYMLIKLSAVALIKSAHSTYKRYNGLTEHTLDMKVFDKVCVGRISTYLFLSSFIPFILFLILGFKSITLLFVLSLGIASLVGLAISNAIWYRFVYSMEKNEQEYEIAMKDEYI